MFPHCRRGRTRWWACSALPVMLITLKGRTDFMTHRPAVHRRSLLHICIACLCACMRMHVCLSACIHTCVCKLVRLNGSCLLICAFLSVCACIVACMHASGPWGWPHEPGFTVFRLFFHMDESELSTSDHELFVCSGKMIASKCVIQKWSLQLCVFHLGILSRDDRGVANSSRTERS